jgi:hypothetical protein
MCGLLLLALSAPQTMMGAEEVWRQTEALTETHKRLTQSQHRVTHLEVRS